MKITVTVQGGADYYNELLDTYSSEIAERLIKIGRQRAAEKLAAAEYAGYVDVRLEEVVGWTGEAQLVARGQSAAFVEFGTGADDAVSSWHPLFYLVPPRGSYGKGKGANPPWYYKGDPGSTGTVLKNGWIRTYGNDPVRYMYDALVLMRREAPRVAKEVFE